MSISPFKPSANQIDRSNSDRLTLSQALLITAGLAGLVGLCSGAIIRFSLSNSDNARFLSPLQTFPALSNWASDLPQDTDDEDSLPSGGASLETRDDLQTPSRIQTFESLGDRPDPGFDEDQAIELFDPSTFDTFADRGNNASRISDPLEALQNGPTTIDSAGGRSENRNNKRYQDSEAYPEAEYPDENYPEIEEPIYSNGSYYENQSQW